MNTSSPNKPPQLAWNREAAALWAAGRQPEALALLMQALNAHGEHKPTPLVLQLVYYMFQRGDWASAAACLRLQHASVPDNLEVLLNLAVCLSRSGQVGEAVLAAQRYLTIKSDEPMAWDVLASSLSRMKRWAEAQDAGTRSLVLKDGMAVTRAQSTATVPNATPQTQLQHQSHLPAPPEQPRPGVADPARPDVIAFSLWGQQSRYLLGMTENLLAAPELFPSWRVRIYLDDSVPLAWQGVFRKLGAELVPESPHQTVRQRLCWRFKVANDPGVHRFMVRDCDSVIGLREQAAVQAWLQSGQAFHVMRDWWTHTDVMLAGMWGGTAGLLPDLTALLMAYKSNALETFNIDQWFLRDEVWALLRNRCLVHDRCYKPPGAQPWPTAAADDNTHVGQNVHAVDAKAQLERVKARVPELAAVAHP